MTAIKQATIILSCILMCLLPGCNNCYPEPISNTEIDELFEVLRSKGDVNSFYEKVGWDINSVAIESVTFNDGREIGIIDKPYIDLKTFSSSGGCTDDFMLFEQLYNTAEEKVANSIALIYRNESEYKAQRNILRKHKGMVYGTAISSFFDQHAEYFRERISLNFNEMSPYDYLGLEMYRNREDTKNQIDCVEIVLDENNERVAFVIVIRAFS